MVMMKDDGRRWPMKRVAKNTTNKRVTRRADKTVPRMNDPIRIVPLYLPSELYRPLAGMRPPRPHNWPTAGGRCWTR